MGTDLYDMIVFVREIVFENVYFSHQKSPAFLNLVEKKWV